jgi:hypothetical protein
VLDVQKGRPTSAGPLACRRIGPVSSCRSIICSRYSTITPQPSERRDRMAIAAAPYLHTRLSTIATAKATFEMTTAEIDELLARELEHAQQQGDEKRVREIEASLGRYH